METSQVLNLNIGQQERFIEFFHNLPQKPSSTIRCFNHTDFYTVHGDDAVFAGNLFSIYLNYIGEEPNLLSYICLSKSHFPLFMRELLLVRHYRVEVYVKLSQAQNDWVLHCQGSPGNLSQFEDILFDNFTIEFTNCVMAIKVCPNKIIAVCNVNITDVKFELCEVTDNDSFSELQSIITQIGPKECLIPIGDTPELVSLKKVIEHAGISVESIKKSNYITDGSFQDLNKLLYFDENQQINAAAYTETNMVEAMGCLHALINYLNLTSDSKNFNQYKLTTFDVHSFVKLGSSVLHSLNILPKVQSHIFNGLSNANLLKSSSLKSLLDNCVTAQGHRLIDQWIKQPLTDKKMINDRLDVVETFVSDCESRELLKDKLAHLADLISLTKKLAGKKANLQDCYKIYSTNSVMPSIVKILNSRNNKTSREMLIGPINKIIENVKNFQNMIEQFLDLELVEKGEYLVKSSFNEVLSNLHNQKNVVQEKIQKLLPKVSADLGLEKGKNVKLCYNDIFGYYFRVTLKSEATLRKKNEYEILDINKTGAKFKNSKLSELNDEYSNIITEYKEKQKNIESDIVKIALRYSEDFRNLTMLIARIDVLLSFASAAKNHYVRPRLHKMGSGMLNLKRVRHPCLEAQDSISYIPNDVDFNTKEKMLFLITGPNMCGKSTYIISIGLCVYMAQIGSFVPCDKADISIIDSLLVRVGADDCQLKGLSTFMVEMVETSSIIKNATSNSLVIIDELGRGTSTYDGFGTAWAVVDHLINEIKCFSLFATHFHEITHLANEFSNISNLHVRSLVDKDKFIPLYHVYEGECDKSYGIHCAKMVKFPEDVIKDAQEYQNNLEHSNGIRFISSEEPSSRRKIISEGDKVIDETLSELQKLNVEEMTPDDLIKKISEIKTQLLAKNNLFIKGLLE